MEYGGAMIVSFRDKRTRDFAGGKYVKAFSGFSRQAELKLDQLDAATTLKDLAALPGNQLERLKGDRKDSSAFGSTTSGAYVSNGPTVRRGRSMSRLLIIMRKTVWHVARFTQENISPSS